MDTTLKSSALSFDNVIRQLIEETTKSLNVEKESLEKAKAILRDTDKGDASENAPLQIARDEVAMRTSMVSLYSKRIDSMESDIGNYVPDDYIKLGTTLEVTLTAVPAGLKNMQGQKFIIKLVKHDTGKAKLGLVAIDTKLGTALVGRTAGETVNISAPAGSFTYKIERIY